MDGQMIEFKCVIWELMLVIKTGVRESVFANNRLLGKLKQFGKLQLVRLKLLGNCKV